MGFFDAFKNKRIVIAAPVNGTCVAIQEVRDPTFRDEILGKGVAVIPTDGKICAPADGTVTTMFPTGHAFGMTTDDGVELLVHVGLDTVALKGDGFCITAKEGQKVKKGDLMMEADLKKIKEAGYDTITPVVICNTSDYAEVKQLADGMVRVGDDIIDIKIS